MAVFILNGTEKIIDVISSTKKYTVELITIRKNFAADPLTQIFKNMPDDISSHSIRVGVISRMLAEQAVTRPEGMDKINFANIIQLGGMYHHIPEQDLTRILPLRADNNDDFLMEIIRRQDGPELAQDSSPLAARLVYFAGMLDERLIKNDGQTAQNIVRTVRYIRDKGAGMYGLDTIKCFAESYKKIFDLYLSRSRRVKNGRS